jgi:hypothetical protein
MVVRLMRKLFFIDSFFSFGLDVYSESFAITGQEIKLNYETVQ